MFNNFLAAMPQIKAGRLRVLAVTSAKRSQVMPELATMAESGLPGFDVTGWYALLAPAERPRPIVAKVQDRCADALGYPRSMRGFDRGRRGTRRQHAGAARGILAAEIRKWAKVIRRREGHARDTLTARLGDARGIPGRR